MKMNVKIMAVVLLCTVLGGCSGFKSSAPPPTLYMLHATPGGPQASRGGHVVAIAEPSVPAGFESNKIVIYLARERRMDYAAGASWPAPLPKVLQDFILQSAGASSGITAVTPDSGIAAPYNLLVRMNDFEPAYASDQKAPPELKASMTFTLVSQERQRIVASFTLAAKKTAAANTLTSITGGLEALAQDLTSLAFQKIAVMMRPKPVKRLNTNISSLTLR